ncbi:tenascin-N isoform X2 [Sardina pilchardus]|uniref:tenascin-N isoform X2 n=1 Tax=Sardina pilchardus TaxID=27697 RepID=UPI002E0E3374
MVTRLSPLGRLLLMMGTLLAVSLFTVAEDQGPEKGVTFSHVYKIGTDCKVGSQALLSTDQNADGALQEMTVSGENDVVFKHNIRLQTPSCSCADSDDFKSLLYRVNGLEEEVTYLKAQCAQGCCKSAGMDTSCSGHGTFQHDTCKCQCNPGWQGPDCSESMCPDDCNDNGRCVDGRCVCHTGYGGDDCSQLLCPDNCNDKGHCVDGKCVCFSHFTGPDCSVQRCLNDCIGNGRCVDGRCICDEGFFGDDCSMVMGPKELRLLEATEMSLLVEWDRVRGAEYYVLTYHPEGDEGALITVNVPNTENSYLITGLVPGLTYIVEVYAVIKEINSESVSLEAATELSGVSGIRVLGQTEDSIQVDWKNPDIELDHFRLTHASTDGEEESETVAMSEEARTKHTIVGLLPGTEYLITVQTVKGTSEGKASSVTGHTDIDSPTQLVTREVTESTATVTWDQVQSEIDGYRLSYVSAVGSSQEITVGAGTTTYQLTGLRPGVVYTVYVWAYKGSRSSRKSSTEAETEIDAPRNLQASDIQLETAALSWAAPQADIDGYILTYRPADGSMQTVEKKLKKRELKFALSGLLMSKRYIVTLIAYRGAKRSRLVETTFNTVGLAYPFPMDCLQHMKNGNLTSGVYTIYINSDRSRPIQVYCDMTTDGGGWLVFQRRNSGRLDFMKRWRQYIQGFGELTDEFWLGLDKIYELTNTPTQYELRFDLGFGSERAYAVYDNFRIAPIKQKFTLTVGKYRGNAGDAMTYHQGRNFTTVDNDNDIALSNCALMHRGAWWYKNCHLANLNGKMGDNRHSMGMNWEPWKGHLMSLDFSEIKIRPVGALSRKRRSLMAKEKKRLAKSE